MGTSTVWKNGEPVFTFSGRIENMTLSKNGYDVMILAKI